MAGDYEISYTLTEKESSVNVTESVENTDSVESIENIESTETVSGTETIETTDTTATVEDTDQTPEGDATNTGDTQEKAGHHLYKNGSCSSGFWGRSTCVCSTGTGADTGRGRLRPDR